MKVFCQQGEPVLYKKNRQQTDVFVLNTCSPTQISLRRKYEDTLKTKPFPVRHLSVNVNKFSGFIIENINPFRYNYYVNNVLVTQFLEQSAINIDNNTFQKGANKRDANDIEILEIFKPGKFDSTQRQKLAESKKLIKEFQKSVSDLDAKYYAIRDSLILLVDPANFDFENNVIKPKLGISALDKKSLNTLILHRASTLKDWLEAYTKYQDEVDNYKNIVGNLTINNNINEILYSMIKIDSSIDTTKEKLYRVAKNISFQTRNNSKTISNLDSIILIGNELLNYDSIVLLLRKVKIDSLVALCNRNGYFFDMSKLKEENTRKPVIGALYEFVAEQKLKVMESFVISTSLEIGKLLQDEVTSSSRFQNFIKDQTCINDIFDTIEKKKDELTKAFTFLQDVCADLNVLIKYIELDNDAINKSITDINSNYSILLKYLKNIDYVNKNNTREFTLPSHTNLKNVDLIRYQVDREDKLSGSNQTYVYDLWLKGGLKIDFSVGIFATSLIDYAYNKTQVYLRDTSVPVLVNDSAYINRVDQGRFDFAFGGMVNVAPRLGTSWINIGASVGVAYSNNEKLQFLGAVSLHFGKTERLIVHGGFAAGSIRTIDLSNLTYDKNYPDNHGRNYKVKANFDELNILTIDKFSFKPFFGISYNLSKKNALQAVSGKGFDKFNSFQNGTGTTNTGGTVTP